MVLLRTQATYLRNKDVLIMLYWQKCPLIVNVQEKQMHVGLSNTIWYDKNHFISHNLIHHCWLFTNYCEMLYINKIVLPVLFTTSLQKQIKKEYKCCVFSPHMAGIFVTRWLEYRVVVPSNIFCGTSDRRHLKVLTVILQSKFSDCLLRPPLEAQSIN